MGSEGWVVLSICMSPCDYIRDLYRISSLGDPGSARAIHDQISARLARQTPDITPDPINEQRSVLMYDFPALMNPRCAWHHPALPRARLATRDAKSVCQPPFRKPPDGGHDSDF